MRKRATPTFFLCCGMALLVTCSTSAQTYRTETRDKQIKTLQVYPVNDWSASPIINLKGNDKLLVSFDELSHDYKRFAYRIIHCDRNWKKSNLNPLEYAEGFSENDIEAYGTSANTLTNYTHYTFTIPNKDVSLKLSGNYAIEVFDRDDAKKIRLTACFSVLDNSVSIKGLITANTNIDTEQNHQQVQFQLSPLGWIIRQPESEIEVRVRQNREIVGEAKNLSPDLINPDKLVYEHIQDLIFEGGNEFRRFEIATFKHAGIGVNRVEYFAPYYNAEILESRFRNKGYVYDQDQDGRYLVHTTDNSSDETNADYFLVHFSFPMDSPLPDGSLYLYGDLVENRLNEDSRLQYNDERKAYEKTLFLKQGSYNYKYVFVSSTDVQPNGRPSVRQTEGSYWQTENEYQIYIFYKPMGGKYDQLIGFTTLKSSF